jgi:hypothetical protein
LAGTINDKIRHVKVEILNKINVKTSDLNPSVMCTSKSKITNDRLILIKLSRKKFRLGRGGIPLIP